MSENGCSPQFEILRKLQIENVPKGDIVDCKGIHLSSVLLEEVLESYYFEAESGFGLHH